MNLKETFDKYVKAVQNADIKQLFSTVTENEKILFLTASGAVIDTKKEYYTFHEEWFNQKGWEMPVKLIDIHEGETYGYTVALFYYSQQTPQGVYNLDSYFTLIFKKEKGEWKVVADICTPVSRSVTEEGVTYDSEQVTMFNTIKDRRTVRKFRSDPIPEEHILKILDTARYAPTARNRQPWKFLVVQNKEKLDFLKEKAVEWYMETHGVKETVKIRDDLRVMVATMAKDALSAPVYVAVLVDLHKAVPEYALYDGVLAAGHLMIAATALGYATGFYTQLFPEEKMKEFFHIPDEYALICFTPIGVPEKEPEEVPKKDLKDLIVFESFKSR